MTQHVPVGPVISLDGRASILRTTETHYFRQVASRRLAPLLKNNAPSLPTFRD